MKKHPLSKILFLIFTTCVIAAIAFGLYSLIVKQTQDPEEVIEQTQKIEDTEYRAMWISYLEFKSVDFTSEDAFISDIETIFTNCENLKLNTVIVQVRPFGDALYKSEIFPSSHFITGTQGDDIPFDPLKIMVEIAHKHNLNIEAWINPYRIQLNSELPNELSDTNPAVIHPEWTVQANGGLFYNPAMDEVQSLVNDGIKEIVENYDVDGIQFDDYFYPSTSEDIDKIQYESSNTSLSLEEWRIQNINNLVKSIYDTIKSVDKNVVFGISPLGNNDNNINTQYSDVNEWLKTPGYVDYIMPQLYWGYNYLTSNGDIYLQFKTLCDTWSNYERDDSVKLYIGLATYRIGDGDGGNNDQTEWTSGENIANMISTIEQNNNIDGYGLYRYDFLYNNTLYSTLADSEVNNITIQNNK